MTRRFIPFSLVLLPAAFLFTFCGSGKKEENEAEKPSPINVSRLSAPFAESFTHLLDAYYELSDALTNADTVKANAAAQSLLLNADNLKISDIQGDTTGTIKETAQVFSGTISGSATALMGEAGIEEKRREFNMITDALWNLTRTVRYDVDKMYYQFCPAALDNSGGYWISKSRQSANPYLGNAENGCGEVTDSVDYRKN